MKKTYRRRPLSANRLERLLAGLLLNQSRLRPGDPCVDLVHSEHVELRQA